MWIDYCVNVICINGGICNNIVGKVFCSCLFGFVGLWCEINIDECYFSLCCNGGSCVDKDNSFYCVCLVGIWGDVCD